jgi:hypothetical protein
MAEKISSQRNWAAGRARNASVPHDAQKPPPERRMEL